MSAEVIVDSTALYANERIGGSHQASFEGRGGLARAVGVPVLLLLALRGQA